jgi:hypothetical protein
MSAAMPTVLQPAVVNERVNRVKVINTTLQRLFGCMPGGPNERTQPIRRGAYDTFNDTRAVGNARRPGTSAGTIARQVVGSVNYTIPHHFDRMDIPMELVNNIRPIGGPAGQIDVLGQQYMADQEKYMKQRCVNIREFQLAAMLRGSYTFTVSGDELKHTFSGGTHTINYQIPSGNLTTLDMLGAGAIIGAEVWSTTSNDIIAHLEKINAAMIQLTGMGLEHVLVDSVGWGYVRKNTAVQNAAGTSQRYFDILDRDDELQTFTAKLTGLPWVTFHIIDNVLDVNGTTTKIIPSNRAAFLPSLNGDWFKYMVCPSPVVEYDGATAKNVVGDYYWYATKGNPAKYELFSKFDGLPRLDIPAALAWGNIAA